MVLRVILTRSFEKLGLPRPGLTGFSAQRFPELGIPGTRSSRDSISTGLGHLRGPQQRQKRDFPLSCDDSWRTIYGRRERSKPKQFIGKMFFFFGGGRRRRFQFPPKGTFSETRLITISMFWKAISKTNNIFGLFFFLFDNNRTIKLSFGGLGKSNQYGFRFGLGKKT